MKTKRILCFLLVLAFSANALAAALHGQTGTTITVDTTSDVISSDGFCSLREAIVAANTDSPFQDCPAGSGADTVVLKPGLPPPAVLTLAIGGTGEDSALTGDLDIAGQLTISATDAIVIDGNGIDRIFEILPGARVTISGLTIRHGDPGVGAHGGGLIVDSTAVLTLTHSTVISNTALRGGGIKVLGRLNLSDATVDANQGGGITVDGGSSTLNNVQIRGNGGAGIRHENLASLAFDNGTVSGNTGGGIYNNASTATLSHVAVISNTGSGGVFSTGSGTRPARLVMSACTVSSNKATNGGGILSQGINARANINDTDISGNTATSAGGGVFNNGLMTLNGSTLRHNRARSGGGIDHFGGNLYLTNDTLSGNVAGDNGGGLYNRSSAILTNVTFHSNTANGIYTGGNIFNDTALLSIVNAIVAYSEADGNCFNSEGFLNSLGHNLESADTCGFGATGDMVNTDPLLGPLQNNGGPTPTHALLPGSPAIDAGDNAACPATDQRGVARPQGDRCDVGAYELISTGEANLGIDKADSADPVEVGTPLTYTLAVSNSGPNTATAVTVTDVLPAGVVYGGISGSGWNCGHAGGVVTCTLPTLAVGAAPNIIITVIAPERAGSITNSASITSATADPNTANNTDTESTRVEETAAREADLSISKQRAGAGQVMAGERVTYTIVITNAGPTTPVTATVVDTWTPIAAVIGVDAPGCETDLAGGVVTCTRAGLGLGSVLLPDPYLVFTTSTAFSGTLVNTASITTTGGIVDGNPANNVSAPVAVSVARGGSYTLYLPLVSR
jgi:uncharacterized repeat protein (TIGR01451 family)/CSLREA domain-containing protein